MYAKMHGQRKKYKQQHSDMKRTLCGIEITPANMHPGIIIMNAPRKDPACTLLTEGSMYSQFK